MKHINLGIAWNWEFDKDFVDGIEKECWKKNLSTLQITPQNLQEVIKEICSGKLSFHVFYDRASDADIDFIQLVELLQSDHTLIINPHEYVAHAIDKASMHLEFITHGIQVPYTIILPPYNEKKDLEQNIFKIDNLGSPFIIKPANTTGGGTGVILDAKTFDDILRTRQDHPDDKYLVQEKIYPRLIDGKRGWFRVYYAFGETLLCWWDDITHMYSPLLQEDEEHFGLTPLRTIIQTIQNICHLDFFSSEIVLTKDNKFVVVDYVNEICDMRLQSKYSNGAPDEIVHRIQELLAEKVEKHIREIKT